MANGEQALMQMRKTCEETSRTIKQEKIELQKMRFNSTCGDPDFRLTIFNFVRLISDGMTVLIDAKIFDYERDQKASARRGEMRQIFFRSLAERGAWVVIALIMFAIAAIWRCDAIVAILKHLGG